MIYDRRSLKVLTIYMYDPRYRENASTTYDLRSLPFLTIRDLRSMTFQLRIDDLSPFVRFTIYGSRGSIRCLRSTIDDLSFNVDFEFFQKRYVWKNLAHCYQVLDAHIFALKVLHVQRKFYFRFLFQQICMTSNNRL